MNYYRNYLSHLFRNIARPKEAYEDGRVGKFLDLIQVLGNRIFETHRANWSYLVHSVIDVYKHKKADEEKEEEEEEM